MSYELVMSLSEAMSAWIADSSALQSSITVPTPSKFSSSFKSPLLCYNVLLPFYPPKLNSEYYWQGSDRIRCACWFLYVFTILWLTHRVQDLYSACLMFWMCTHTGPRFIVSPECCHCSRNCLHVLVDLTYASVVTMLRYRLIRVSVFHVAAGSSQQSETTDAGSSRQSGTNSGCLCSSSQRGRCKHIVLWMDLLNRLCFVLVFMIMSKRFISKISCFSGPENHVRS
jgi:hypothetical protein